jgi:hypothetical protein
VATVLGGGAAMTPGGFVGPTYSIQGGKYSNVGAAFNAVDGALTSTIKDLGQVKQEVAQLQDDSKSGSASGSGNGSGSGNHKGGHGAGANGDAKVAAAPAVDGTGSKLLTVNARVATVTGGTLTTAGTSETPAASVSPVAGTSSSQTVNTQTVTAQAADSNVALSQAAASMPVSVVPASSAAAPRQVTNLATVAAATDPATVGQVGDALQTAKTYADAGDKTTLATAEAYTDSKLGSSVSSADFNTFRGQVADQFSSVNQRLDRVGAMGTAMSQMTANTSGLAGDNRVGVGAGTYGGQSAISVGYQRAFARNRASVSVGASVSGSESSVGVGGGYSW